MDQQLFQSIVRQSESSEAWEPETIFLEGDDGGLINLTDYVTGGAADKYSTILLQHNDAWSDPHNSKHRTNFFNISIMPAELLVLVYR